MNLPLKPDDINAFKTVTRIEQLEALIGQVSPIVLQKEVNALDPGCKTVLCHSSLAGFGFRDQAGISHTILVGGRAGFMRVDSPTQISFEKGELHPLPAAQSGVSFVFLIPGVGETLRINGTLAESSGTRLVIDVQAAYVHCARAILRSDLWKEPQAVAKHPSPGQEAEMSPCLLEPEVIKFLAQSPFMVISSWNQNGASDTSPRGDHAGFLQALDSQTLALPDRRGNRRADTLHNVLEDSRISLCAVIPGRDDVLQLHGRAQISDDPSLLSSMALNGKLPHAALLIGVEHAEISINQALRDSKLWLPVSQTDSVDVPDLNQVAIEHLASSAKKGVAAVLMRLLSSVFAFIPKRLSRQLMGFAYRKELENEGYSSKNQKKERP